MSWEAAALPVIMTLIGALLALLAWANKKWGAFVDSKVESDYFNSVLKKLAELATTVVKELQQTVVTELKEDNKWTKETAVEVKAQAMATLKGYLGPKGLQEVMEVFGLTDGTLLDQLLSSLIEAKVNDLSS